MCHIECDILYFTAYFIDGHVFSRVQLFVLGLNFAERICPISKIEKEDKYHLLNICPAYQEKRCLLLDYLEKEYRIKISRMSPNKILMFLINPLAEALKYKN